MWINNLNYVKQRATIVVFNATKDISNLFPKINSGLIYMGCFKGVLLNWKVENQHQIDCEIFDDFLLSFFY
jgi:hypothetical protein